jgi:putative Ca2+/H+ antiporter (TMEM165/GDT1 family)
MMTVPAPDADRTAELARRRRRRNIALGIVLALFAITFYALTIAKMGPALFNREL